MKRCTVCGQDKHDLAFAINRRHPDGLANECRPCQNEYQRLRRLPTKGASKKQIRFGIDSPAEE